MIKYGIKSMHNGDWSNWFMNEKQYTTDINEAYRIKNQIECQAKYWMPEVIEYNEVDK